MGIITRVSDKLFFSTIFISLFFSKGQADMKVTYGKPAHEVITLFVKEMRKYGYHCFLTGGSTPYDICSLDVGFSWDVKGSIDLGREKIVFLTERFLEIINNHEGIRPYLREYPFPASRVDVGITFKQPDSADATSIADVYHTRGIVFYSMHSEDKKPSTVILKEPYSDALTKTKNKIPDSPLETVLDIRYPQQNISKKRLGALVEDLRGFKPGSQLEALGIRSVKGYHEIASDIGELIGGVCDLYFDEEFLERVALAAIQYPNGEYVEYWDNGQIKVRIPLKDGYAEGHIHAWYQDGEDAFKGFYQNKKRVGIQLACYPEEIQAGSPIGRLLEYDREGKLHNRQITRAPKVNLLTWIYYKHGLLDGTSTLLTGINRGEYVGRWLYKRGKFVKDKTPKSKS